MVKTKQILDLPKNHPGFRSGGRYYSFLGNGTSTAGGTNGTALGSLTYSLIYIPKPVTIDRICINVNAGVATSLARYGFYFNENGLPGNLIVDAGEVSCATTGAKEAVISAIELPSDWYWAAINSSGALPNLTLVTGSGFKNQDLYGYSSVSPGSSMYGYRQSSVSYGALPSTAPISSLTQSSGSNVLFYVRTV